MSSVFNSAAKRREFFYRLIEKNFKARMHSYEYFIRAQKFVCIVVLNPLWNAARLYTIPWNIEESKHAIKTISEMIQKIDPSIKITVIEPASQ